MPNPKVSTAMVAAYFVKKNMVNAGTVGLNHAELCEILPVLGRFPRFKNPVNIRILRGLTINGNLWLLPPTSQPCRHQGTA